MSNTKKMTKRDYFNILKSSYPSDAPNYDAVIAFIDHELELLDKKNAADKKPTAQQIANKAYSAAIIEFMKPNQLYTITELLKQVPALAADPDMTNQRVSAMMRLMPEKIERVEDKRKAYFRLREGV